MGLRRAGGIVALLWTDGTEETRSEKREPWKHCEMYVDGRDVWVIDNGWCSLSSSEVSRVGKADDEASCGSMKLKTG